MAPIYLYLLLGMWFSHRVERLVAALLLAAFVGQSRLGLGVHAVNQVLLGLGLGSASLMVYTSWLYRKIN